MLQILAISRDFPPLGSPGASIRLVKFIKYITSLGWQFIVITQDPTHPVPGQKTLCASLQSEVPQDTSIVRVPTPFSPKRAYDNIAHRAMSKLMGNSSLLWGWQAFRESLRLLKTQPVDLIYAVTPPFTNALIGLLIKWLTGKPFVLDLKDDWVGSALFQQKSLLRKKIDILSERVIITNTDAVTTVTSEIFDIYYRRYRQLQSPCRLHLIPNGSDLEEFYPLWQRIRVPQTELFTILAASSGFRKEYRDLTPFLSGLSIFLKRNSSARGKTRVVLLGSSGAKEHYNSLISELDLQAIIHEFEPVERKALVEWLWQADLFLLIQPYGNTAAPSGTFYEYWATGKAPILLISETGAASKLLQEYRLGKHCHFTDIELIASYLEIIYTAHQHGTPIWIRRDGIEAYDRKKLAQRMADVFSHVVSQTKD